MSKQNIILNHRAGIPVNDTNRVILEKYNIMTNSYGTQKNIRCFEPLDRKFIQSPGNDLLAILPSNTFIWTNVDTYEWKSISITLNYKIEEDCMCLPSYAKLCKPYNCEIQTRGNKEDGSLEYDDEYILDSQKVIKTYVTNEEINTFNLDYEKAKKSHFHEFF